MRPLGISPFFVTAREVTSSQGCVSAAGRMRSDSNCVNKHHRFFEDFEIASLLGSQRVSVEVRNDHVPQIGSCRAVKNSNTVRVCYRSLMCDVGAAALKERMNLLENREVIGAKSNDELRSRPWELSLPVPMIRCSAQKEATFAVHESRQPMPKCVAVNVGRKSGNRIGLSHDVSLSEEGLPVVRVERLHQQPSARFYCMTPSCLRNIVTG